MFTVSDILQDIDRGCLANNMIEDSFSYRIIFYVNEGNRSGKHYIDTRYGNLRESLEGIIRGHLSLSNNVVIANTTALKDGKCVRLQDRAYSFSLDGYFRRIKGEYNSSNKNGNIMYGYAGRWN